MSHEWTTLDNALPRKNLRDRRTSRKPFSGRGFLSGRQPSQCQFEQLEPRQMLTEVAPNFGLVDVNPSSSTYDQSVSPRDYLGGVSAWYFGKST